MQWHMIIHHEDDQTSRMSITSLMEALSARYRESNLPDGYGVFVKVASFGEKHYFFSPTVSDIAKDILAIYNVFPISAPESLSDLHLITL